MNNNDILSVASFIVGVIGIALAIVFYIKSKRKRKLTYHTKSFGLLSDTTASLKDFRASYNGHNLNRLTIVKILIWNSGNDIIQAADIAESEPIRFQLPDDIQILDVIISSSSSPTNNATIHSSPDITNEAKLSFDYFGPNEGCIISLLHTGRESDSLAPLGTIKGEGQPKKYIFPNYFGPPGSMGMPLILMMIVAPALKVLSEKPWWILVPGAILLLVGLFLLLYRLVKLSQKMTGGSLDQEFEGDFLPRDFIK